MTTHTIEEQQEVAKYVLQKLEIIDPCCILAGGAPRDWDLGTPANDLDFYLYLGHNSVFGLRNTKLKQLVFLMPVRLVGTVKIRTFMNQTQTLFEFTKHMSKA